MAFQTVAISSEVDKKTLQARSQAFRAGLGTFFFVEGVIRLNIKTDMDARNENFQSLGPFIFES